MAAARERPEIRRPAYEPGRGRLGRALLVLAVLLAAPAAAGAASESSSCRRAREIVEEVAKLFAAGQPDHAQVLQRLEVARDLCPSLGDAWKYSACSAQALGQTQKARTYTDRAVLDGVSDLQCSKAAPAPISQLGPFHDKFALVVGIGSFQDPRIPKLRYPGKDATDFRDYLVDPQGGRFPASNVRLLTNEGATRKAILQALQAIFDRAQDDDLLVVFLSSHGTPNEKDLGLKGVGSIVTYETNFEDRYVDSLEFKNLADKISLIKARRKVIFLDTCFSGQMTQSGGKTIEDSALGVSDETARLFTSAEGSYLLTSSDSNEQSWESDKLKNGFFTYFLLSALRSGSEPPTLQEVFSSLVKHVPPAVLAEKGARQTPQIQSKSGPGDLRLGAASVLGSHP